jgi:hypothetical protein
VGDSAEQFLRIPTYDLPGKRDLVSSISVSDAHDLRWTRGTRQLSALAIPPKICESLLLSGQDTADVRDFREGLGKPSLVELVLAQFDCWPHQKYKWAPKRETTVKILKKVLLDPSYGFGMIG